ncbi:MAG: hypothetical protein QM784_13275 [Polyangiaceae bacterium]
MNWQSYFACLPSHARSRRGQSALAAVVLVAATTFYLWFGNETYPIRDWLFWRYLSTWSFVLLFLGASLAAGWTLLAKLLPEPPRLPERLVLSIALGVLSFYWLMFVTGIARLYSPFAFFGVPMVLLGIGGHGLLVDLQRYARKLPAHVRTLRSGLGVVDYVAFALALVALIGIYLQVILPRNSHADSHWYHFPIAEHYVAAGGIVRFPEGWYVGVYPQLASILYTWVFLLPTDLFSHVTLCQHLDFALFCVTAASVAVLAARLVSIRHFPAAVAVIFLFPNLFIYDSNVSGNADHILGFWAAPIGLALVRFGRRFVVREGILAGLLVAASAVTKYQGSYFVVPSVLFVLLLTIRNRKLSPSLAWLGVVVAVTATHWLKNLIYYHDPLYPLLHRYLPSKPFYAGAELALEASYWPHQFQPNGSATARVLDALKASITFSFVPNDWGWHGNRPTFGSLFTLLVPMLLVCRAPRRLWMLTLGTQVGLVVWHLTSHQDRFLQALLPWMASCTAALLWLTWRRGLLARIGVGSLVAAQFVSGLDVYFLRQHAMIGDSPIRETARFIANAHEKKYDERLILVPTFEKLARQMTSDTVLLEHTMMAKLGLGVRVVADGNGWQGAIEYLDHTAPKDTARLFRDFGITKSLRFGDPRYDGLGNAARELAYLRWLVAYRKREYVTDDAKLTDVLPNPHDTNLAAEPTRIAWLVCRDQAMRGLYSPRGLAQAHPLQTFASDLRGESPLLWLRSANAVAIDVRCEDTRNWTNALTEEFSREMSLNDVSLWIRTKR